jgi:O-methyltransferase domain/Dimerisation domain
MLAGREPALPPKPLETIYPGIVAAQAIHAAVELRIPDHLASGPKSATELAAACGAHAPTLERLLRALTSIEVFQRTADGRYRNSPMTDILRRDHPQTLWAETMFLPAPFLWKPMGELSESVRTGEPAFDRVFGQSFFEYLGGHPEEAAAFNRLMIQEILWTTPALLRAYDFSQFKRLVDVAGGHGLFLSQILAATPKLEGILFDQPQVVAGAKDSVKGDVAARMKFAGGSFFESVPEGGDAYVLRRIIHDWEDADAVKILGNLRRAMRDDGTLVLVEGLVDSATNPAGLMDLMMLVLGGRERSEAEFRALVATAGFSLKRVIPAGAYFVIECKPA